MTEGGPGTAARRSPGGSGGGDAEPRVRPAWGTVAALVLSVLALSVIHPVPLVLIPLALLLVALPPRRPALLGLSVVLGVLAFVEPAGDALWYAERGWALVLGAWFLIAAAVRPGTPFLTRGLTALIATVLSAGGLFAAGPGQAWARIDWMIGRRFRDAAADVATLWTGAVDPAGGGLGGSVAGAMYRAAEFQVLVYPALVALASLAGLGLAWWLYRWLSVREKRPLAPFREFRFRDELVWLLIGGILLVVLPLGSGMLRTGSNILTFMVVLYALRGAAVLLAVAGGIGFGGIVAAALVALLLYPLVVVGTILVGVSDTWLDLRSRWRSAVDPG